VVKVSKKVLNKTIEKQIFETLWEAISQIRDKSDIQSFLNDLLSPTERIMVAKRLAIAILLLKEQDYATIRGFLNVSNETISKVSSILKTNQGYKIAINKIAQTKAGKEFWEDIESFLYRFSKTSRVFLPERAIRHKLRSN